MRVILTLAVLGLAAAPAAAHVADVPPQASPSGWDLAALAGLAAAAALYAGGSRRLAGRGARVRGAERAAFWTGWAALVAALAPPLDRAAADAFSAHMAQHELLMLLGVPLVVVGRPIVPWLWALPLGARPVAGAALQAPWVVRAWRALTSPLAATVLHGTAVWVWHLPALYEAALSDEGLHAFQHASLAGTAALFWWGLVYGRYGRAAYGAAALFVFITSVHTGVLGALFALSQAPFYPWYAARAARLGFDVVDDQQLAGLYMWIPAGAVLTLFGLVLVRAWIAEAERRAAARTLGLVLAVALSAGGCGRIPYERSARMLTGGDPSRGRDKLVQYGCDSCHTIPGVVTADATVGPPLARVAQRMYLAGHIVNTPEAMRQWIRNPPAFDPRTVMPDTGVTEPDSRDIVAYLYTLR